jgi:hypothetical protein
MYQLKLALFAFLAVFTVPVHLFPDLGNSCSRLLSKFLRHFLANPAAEMCVFTVGEPCPSVPLHFLHAFHLLIFFARHHAILRYFINPAFTGLTSGHAELLSGLIALSVLPAILIC